jgi:hypothetical protein
MVFWRKDPFLGKVLETNETTAVAMQRLGKSCLYNNRDTAGNGVMQPFARQLQQLSYNIGNGFVFYVVRAEGLF